MPSIQSLDTYLERSTSLLESEPESTLISITYRNKSGKSKESSKGRDQEKSKSAESGASNSSTTRSVSFKTYNDSNGICYRFTTNKAKDLSRVLTALGPKGVQFTKSKKVPSKKRKSEPESISSKKSRKKTKSDLDNYSVEKYSVNGKGFSSILSNVEFKPEEVENSGNTVSKSQKTESTNKASNAGSTKTEETSSKKKKNKKKKGKK